MTILEDYICFRMLYFHDKQARFVVSAENFIIVLFLTYDVVSSLKHYRQHVAACEGIPQSLQPDGAVILSAGRLHVCGGGADATTWTSSPSSSESFQLCSAEPHLPSTAEMLLRNSTFSRSTPQSSRQPHHVSLYSAHHHE